MIFMTRGGGEVGQKVIFDDKGGGGGLSKKVFLMTRGGGGV